MEIILPKFLTALQNILIKNDKDICEKILLEIEQLNSGCIRNISASKSPTCTYLDGTLNNIPKDLSPIDILLKSISKKLVWHEASRGVPKYPLHAHEAEELYIIVSGEACWKIDDRMFSVIPGSIIKHKSCQDHATFTEEEALFAIWIWTGKIKGRYWFADNSEDDCPLEYR